jgi:hypothetical protein
VQKDNMNKREEDFETVVIDYLSPRGYARREQLIKYLKKSHPDGTGYSEASINRKLANMCKADLIIILKDAEDLERYEIKKEAGNASYILTKDALDVKKHYNHVFSNYEKKDINLKKIALKELKRYGMPSFLSPSQLDIMVLDLEIGDDDLVNNLLELLYIQIVNKDIRPGDKDVFLKNLKKLLEKYPDGHNDYRMLRRHVIQLLGYYADKAVLEQLIKDAESGKLSTFQNDYMDKFTARVIENSKTDLFDLEIRLNGKEDTETIKILDEIRQQARDKVNEPIDPDKTVEEILGNPVLKQKIQLNIKGSKK